MFSALPKTNFNYSVTFYLPSTNAFNLDQSENLLYGKGLISYIKFSYKYKKLVFHFLFVEKFLNGPILKYMSLQTGNEI